MHILCFVKPVPDVENFKYDYEKNVLVRSNVHQLINPEDATALARALSIKNEVPGTSIETVTMAPKGAVAHLEDLIRRGVDRATLISDPRFVGSDTYVTSRVIARYLAHKNYDCIFTGTHTLDGGTAHVPAQVAELLDLPHLSHVADAHTEALSDGGITVDVDTEGEVLTFELDLPAIIGFSYSTKWKLPYISYENLSRDVSDKIDTVTNEELGFDDDELGLTGSPTAVAGVEVKTFERTDTTVVGPDDDGVETVYRFLIEKGFLRP
ncbi:MAG: electron transfer flavoprotein subunit beta/FixA family protein [Spirochaeta sp.]|jgi:electron transfer flavoprotein beta subunit|nr:electron transfer flavoprotein subunit beta/FixA family protein [Spirochaeta sp.]